VALRLPQPMLARSAPLPTGDYSFELKWDGFRALLARNGDFRVRSRRGWDMTRLLPELGDLPAHGIFDGELVAFADGVPHFPLVCARLLHGDRRVPLTFVLFDVLELDGEPVLHLPYVERRARLEELELRGGPWFVPDAFGDGDALFAAACEQGLEGVVAKRRLEPYRPGERAWIKVKNRAYWRHGEEIESLRKSIERRRRRRSATETAATRRAPPLGPNAWRLRREGVSFEEGSEVVTHAAHERRRSDRLHQDGRVGL
jgi:ATP-dependent DNA ligase